ncbi:MAG: aminotransferase class V-fold PLP-dependent enzyme, partial [Erysipelotrichales bacterium]|nr:aminotransferase class V-fold PLP-dependent enzyme [Erysipelotrichales bacterium]
MHKTLKRILMILMTVFLVCGLTACSKRPEPTPTPDPAPTPEPTPEPGPSPEPPATAYTIDNIRQYVVGVDEPVELPDGTKQPLINFDNAATTPTLKPVMDAVDEEMKMYGSIGRGFSQKSNHSTDIYMGTRDTVLNFLGADPDYHTVFYV